MKRVDKSIFEYIGKTMPSAYSVVRGGTAFPKILGVVEFYSLKKGVLVVAEVEGLPSKKPQIFGFHIHEGAACKDDFALTGGHFNPNNQPHPSHAGDMPPLFSSEGEAFLVFYTARFSVSEIIGKTVVIHQQPDDFTSQPAGNSGQKIACGVIEKS